MKKFIPAIIIIFIIIASALRNCWSGGDEFLSHSDSLKNEAIPVDAALQHRIDSFVACQPHVGTLGMQVYDITADRELFAYKADTIMRPASCMKLLSCICALRMLGPNYEYRNRLYTTGKMVGDTLMGDVVLKTQFDPFFNQDSLRILLTPLKEKGIKKINGRVVFDVAFTEAMNHEEHWTIGDLRLRNMGILYKGFRLLKRETQYMVRSYCGITVPDSAFVFGRLNPRKATQISEITTPIHNVVERALKNSSNTNAESLMYPLGYLVSKNGNCRKNGVVMLQRFLTNELHMKDAAVLHDGCGLCPDDGMTPRLLVQLLKYARRYPRIYKEVFEDLPLSGTDGTLHDRLYKPHVKGMVKAKTGTLTREAGISTLAGYFTGADGHLIAFAIMNNQCPVMDGRWWQDKIIERAFFVK